MTIKRALHCIAAVAASFYENSNRAASALLRASARSTDSVRATRRALRSSSTKHWAAANLATGRRAGEHEM